MPCLTPRHSSQEARRLFEVLLQHSRFPEQEEVSRLPNHVTNILISDPAVLDAMTRLQDGERVVDFNLIIPTPDDGDPLITSTKHVYKNGMVGYSSDGKSPMDFAVERWGTKWNAYSQVVDDRENRLEFDTAWAHPFPVIDKLSRMFPSEPIKVQFADEDLGSNLGEYVILDGKIIEDTTPTDEEDRINFATLVRYEMSYAEWEAER